MLSLRFWDGLEIVGWFGDGLGVVGGWLGVVGGWLGAPDWRLKIGRSPWDISWRVLQGDPAGDPPSGFPREILRGGSRGSPCPKQDRNQHIPFSMRSRDLGSFLNVDLEILHLGIISLGDSRFCSLRSGGQS